MEQISTQFSALLLVLYVLRLRIHLKLARIKREFALNSFCDTVGQRPATEWLVYRHRLQDVDFDFLLHQVFEFLVDLGKCELLRLLWEHILPASESFCSIQVPNTLIEVVQPPIAVRHQEVRILDELEVQLLGLDLLWQLNHWFVLCIYFVALEISELPESMLSLVRD